MDEKYREYWNDLEIEKGKGVFITSKDNLTLLRHLREQTNLERCFRDAISYSQSHFGGLYGQVLDVGAGVCWSSAIIANLDSVEQVTAIDYSGHRLNIIAPIVIEQFGANPLKVKRIEGDFFKYPFNENSFDVIVFCQALYMFPDLDSTLNRVYNLLKPGGQLIVACERLEGAAGELLKKKRFKKLLGIYKRAITAKVGLTSNATLRDESGRSGYRDKHYRRNILRAGLTYHYQKLNYILFPDNPVLAGNHFGIKARNKSE